MNWKKFVLCAATVLCFAVPSWAGSFGVYGSYWDSDDASSSWGGGVRVGFDFFKWMELEFHGTYFPDFGADILGSNVDITATPVDGGLRFNFLPEKKINVYAGAGASYYFMDASDGSMDNSTGWYGEAGLEFGKNSRFFVEAMWREMDTTLSFSSFDADANFNGVTGQVGFNWKWGK
jgi:outer membrane protein with beta-barrel domain